MDTVQHPGVDEVGENHLVAGVGQREQDVEQRVALGGGHHDLRLGVVGHAAAVGDASADRLLQVEPSGERQVAVRVVPTSGIAAFLARAASCANHECPATPGAGQ